MGEWLCASSSRKIWGFPMNKQGKWEVFSFGNIYREASILVLAKSVSNGTQPSPSKLVFASQLDSTPR